MKKTSILLILIAFSYSCYDAKRKPISIDDENIDSYQLRMDSVIADTTKIITANLPVLIDSARNILVHEIIVTNLSDNDKKPRSFYKSENYSQDYITNLIFEEIPLKSKKTLTDLSLNIRNYSFQYEIYKKTGKELIFYTVTDNDSNKDKKLDHNDINSLYISNIDGTSFKKMTKNNESFINGKFINSQKKYYFKTVQDSNSDGYLTNEDAEHFYYIDFNEDSYQVKEYFPLDILK